MCSSLFKNTVPNIKQTIAETILSTNTQCQLSSSNETLPDNPPNALAPNKPTMTNNKNTLRNLRGKLRNNCGNKVKNRTPVLTLCIILAILNTIKSCDMRPIIEPIKKKETKSR